MPTAPPGGAVLAPAASGDGKEVITSTNTTVRLLLCFHDFSYCEIRIFFLVNIFSNAQNWEKDAFFDQKKIVFFFNWNIYAMGKSSKTRSVKIRENMSWTR